MGRGLFATEAIKEGALVHTAEVLKIPVSETEGDCVLSRYVFGYDKKYAIFALGHGSLFNHSDAPNVEAVIDYVGKRPVMTYYALKEIKMGSELFIDYGPDYVF